MFRKGGCWLVCTPKGTKVAGIPKFSSWLLLGGTVELTKGWLKVKVELVCGAVVV